jgi:hypothetical protein
MTMILGLRIDPNARTRRSSDSVWPLRRADGRTFAEAQAARERKP